MLLEENLLSRSRHLHQDEPLHPTSVVNSFGTLNIPAVRCQSPTSSQRPFERGGISLVVHRFPEREGVITHSLSSFKDQGRLGGLESASHRWRSLIFPDVISTAAGIEKYHLKRGVDPKARERINALAESWRYGLSPIYGHRTAETILGEAGSMWLHVESPFS